MIENTVPDIVLSSAEQIGALAGLTAIVLGSWWVIPRVAHRPPNKAANAVLSAYGLGLALNIVPKFAMALSADSGEISGWPAAASISVALGSALALLAFGATTAILFWVLLSRLLRRP